MKERWEQTEPKKGCQIRVSRGLYYHHGIFLDDLRVVHFGDISGAGAEEQSVRLTTLEEFLKGGYPEVRIYSFFERRKIFSPDKTERIALSLVGSKGYDFVSNNCEHFSNFCAYGKRESMQSDRIAGERH